MYRILSLNCGSLFSRASFAAWLVMNMLLLVVPRYGAYMMTVTGTIMLFTNLVTHILATILIQALL